MNLVAPCPPSIGHLMGVRAAYFKQAIHDRLIDHKQHIAKFGDDLPEIAGWKWNRQSPVRKTGTSTEGDHT